jgi:hypothetical protein
VIDAAARAEQLAGREVLGIAVSGSTAERLGIGKAFHALHRQQQVEDDLVALVRTGSINHVGCDPIDVTSHRAIPQLALLMRISPGNLVDAQLRHIDSGTYTRPASSKIAQEYVLDRTEVSSAISTVPRGFSLVAQNTSWQVYKHCH